jgi:arylsulfatase A-like enzyme
VILLLGALFGCRTIDRTESCTGCDVVWITVDTLRYDRVGAYGATSGLTPAVDALAARGTTFRTAIAQGPHAIVSVPSYLSSRYLHETGMTFDLGARQQYRRLAESVTTLAEVLGVAKYETVGYAANPTIAGSGARFAVEQGFRTWEAASDPEVTRAAIETLTAPRTEPLFLYLHYYGPHTDNPEDAGFEARRGSFDTPIRTKRGATSDLYNKIRAGTVVVDAAGWQWIQALYDDAVARTDALVGQVLDVVATRERPTLVVFTSDNGESLGEIRDTIYVGHSLALWEEDIRVPLVIAGPGVGEHEMVENGIAELVDVAPTITNLVGIPFTPGWGWSGRPLLGPGGAPGDHAISTSRSGTGVKGAIRDQHTKLVADRVGQTAQRFDLHDDPLEQAPTVVDMETDPLGQLLHQSWTDSRIVESQMFVPDEAIDEQVRALGYGG